MNHQRRSGRSLAPLRTDPGNLPPCPKRTDTAPGLTPSPSLPPQLGIKTTEERIVATLQAGKEAGMSAREYQLRRGAALGDGASRTSPASQGALGGAEMEKKSGKPLMTNDAAGMKALYAKVEGLVAWHGR